MINVVYFFYNGIIILLILDEDRILWKRISKMLNMIISFEEKRKIIGDIFVKIVNEVIGEMNLKLEEVFFV